MYEPGIPHATLEPNFHGLSVETTIISPEIGLPAENGGTSQNKESQVKSSTSMHSLPWAASDSKSMVVEGPQTLIQQITAVHQQNLSPDSVRDDIVASSSSSGWTTSADCDDPKKQIQFSRLSPVSLLGRPRHGSCSSNSSGGTPTSDTTTATQVRRQVIFPHPSSLSNMQAQTTTIRVAPPHQPTHSSSDQLAALSNLTIANNTDTSVQFHRTSTGSSATSAEVTQPFRVPLYSSDGQVVGYRQPSAVLRRQMEVSDYDIGMSPPESPLFAVSPTFRNQPIADEFSSAILDPHAGFPDAESRVPGYILGPVIGRGGFCTVRKALHVATSLPVAFKIIDKARLKDPKDRDRVDREMRVMRQLSGHVGVVQLLECAETSQYVYIVMEYCKGGSLLDAVRDRRKLPEQESAQLFQQLVHALEHCHQRGIVHRDIKLENVLLDGCGSIRLVDFGLAGYYLPGKRLRCHCGSPSYAAPEIVGRREYLAPPVDVWSLGIVLFAMISGYLPFQAKDKRLLSEKIMAGIHRPPAWMSSDAADLIRCMLEIDPAKRITLDEIKRHRFVTAFSNGLLNQSAGNDHCSAGMMNTMATVNTEIDNGIVQACAAIGIDAQSMVKSLKMRECNSVTAVYHLLRLNNNNA